MAYQAGMGPLEFRQSTLAEILAYLQAVHQRWALEHDARAWMVAHLMLATGHYPRTLTLLELMRQLLGRDPHGLAPPAAMSPDETAAHLKAWVDGPRTQPARRRERD